MTTPGPQEAGVQGPAARGSGTAGPDGLPARPPSATGLRWGPLLGLAGAFAAMLALSWGKWPDVLVDFGHELYIPWQLSQGKALARDIDSSATGPLSPHVNAWLFRVFGPGLWVLVVANLALLVVLTGLLFGLLRDLFDRATATLGCLVFLAVFAFGQYVGIGNYNYVTPYSHGATHGMLLALASIGLLGRHARTGRGVEALGAGLGLGLVLLTKPELFVACAGALGAGFVAARAGGPVSALLRAGGGLVLGTAAPAVVAVLLLGTRVPLDTAWRAALAPWVAAWASEATRTPFYARGLGLDRPLENLGLLLWWLGAYAVLLAPAAIVDRLAGRGARPHGWLVALGSVGLGVALFLWVPRGAWFDAARPLPLLALAGAVAYAILVAWRRRAGEGTAREVGGLMLSVFAAGLLAKMALNARTYHYGFVLAMPASLLVVGWLTRSIPDWLRRRGGPGTLFRSVALALIAVVAVAHVLRSAVIYGSKVLPVGTGVDAFRADARGRFVAEMIERIRAHGPATGTLAVLPEGVMVNYLTRRENPTPYLGFLSDALAFYGGEGPLLGALQRRPPDLILLVRRDSGEHGPRWFGVDYARATLAWIEASYEPVALAGDHPVSGPGYGMLLLSRRAGPAGAAAGAGRP